MKKIVPFTKELMFKTKIGEITSISIDHTLKLDGQFISGEFIIGGTYKMIDAGKLEEEFNYNIPVDITIDSKYDTSNCTISIDEFTYEIINEETLKINISVMLDDLDIKTDIIETIEIDSRESIEDSLLDDLNEKHINDNLINNTNIEINKDNKDIIDNKKEKIENELFNNLSDEHEYFIEFIQLKKMILLI